MKYLVWIIFLVTIASCQTHNTEKLDTTIVPIRLDWDNVVDELDYSFMVEDSVLAIPLETRDDCLIGEVTKLAYQNNLIYIMDNMSKTIFVFDIKGKLVMKLRAVGNGPGEYINITAFTVVGTDIVIYDHHVSRLFFYNEKGEHIRTEDASDIWGMDMFLLQDKLYLVNNGSNSGKGFYHLFTVNPNKPDEHEAFLPFEDQGNKGWGIGNYAAPLKDEALIYYFPFDTLYTVKDGKAYPSYCVDFGNKRLPQKYINGDGYDALRTAIRENYITGFQRVVQSNRYIFISLWGDKGEYVAVYDKETGETVTTKYLFNRKIGGQSLYVNLRYAIQDEKIIYYQTMENWNIEKLLGADDLDKKEFYSEHLKQQFREFQQMDGECNPVIFIQSLKQ